mmetsp:Transcript_61662/g.163323  ORF Transcript_61662/g.163323 Transcript_61662/m.163323 type:complete len:269 (-) Transcript_61662:487-1293(-)
MHGHPQPVTCERPHPPLLPRLSPRRTHARNTHAHTHARILHAQRYGKQTRPRPCICASAAMQAPAGRESVRRLLSRSQHHGASGRSSGALVVGRDVDVDLVVVLDVRVHERRRVPARRAHGEDRVGRVEELVLAVHRAVGAVDEVEVDAAPLLGQRAVEVEAPERRLLEGRRLVGRRRRQPHQEAVDRRVLLLRRREEHRRAVPLAGEEEGAVLPRQRGAAVGDVRGRPAHRPVLHAACDAEGVERVRDGDCVVDGGRRVVAQRLVED